jgi:hypothetical protein
MGGLTRRLAAISTLRVVAPTRRVLGAESTIDHEIRAGALFFEQLKLK